MNDIRANYVCAVCSQTFTRKPSAERHRENLHSGMAPIVRLIDYLVGRIEGRYQPSNPLLYRRRNKIMNYKKNANAVNDDSPSQFTVMPDGTKETSNEFRFGYKQDPLDVSLDNIRPKMDSITKTNESRLQWSRGQEAVYQKTLPSSYETSTSGYLDWIAKFQEFANLVQKYHSKETAKELLLCVYMLGPKKLEQDGWIDLQLVFLRSYDKIVS